MNLRRLSDFKGNEPVRRVLALVDEQPLHLSIVGGDPLVRYRELDVLLPQLSAKGLHTQVVTSAFREIPANWASIPRSYMVVCIDGLQSEHDMRRRPATYERIIKNIAAISVTVHCTITAPMMQRPRYLEIFLSSVPYELGLYPGRLLSGYLRVMARRIMMDGEPLAALVADNGLHHDVIGRLLRHTPITSHLRSPARLSALAGMAIASASAVSAKSSATWGLWSCFIHGERAPAGVFAIQRSHRLFSFVIVGHFHKAKPARSSGIAIGYKTGAGHAAIRFEH